MPFTVDPKYVEEEPHNEIHIMNGQVGIQEGNIIVRLPFDDRPPVYLVFTPHNNFGSAISLVISILGVLMKTTGRETCEQFKTELNQLMGSLYDGR